ARREDLVTTIQKKAQAFSHAEANHPDIVNEARLNDVIGRNQLWWDASYGSVPLVPVPLDDTFPQYVVNNRARWAPFIADGADAVQPPTGVRRMAQGAAGRIRRAGRALLGAD